MVQDYYSIYFQNNQHLMVCFDGYIVTIYKMFSAICTNTSTSKATISLPLKVMFNIVFVHFAKRFFFGT